MLGLKSSQIKLLLTLIVAWRAYETQVQAQVSKKKKKIPKFELGS